jgi:hypothetical protein
MQAIQLSTIVFCGFALSCNAGTGPIAGGDDDNLGRGPVAQGAQQPVRQDVATPAPDTARIPIVEQEGLTLADDRAPRQDEPAPVSLNQVAIRYTPSQGPVANPERGFYFTYDLVSNPGYARELRRQGMTLGFVLVSLERYRDQPLDDAFLHALQNGFAKARAAGIKLIVRFAYNRDGGADAPKPRMLEHIGQLRTTLHSNADVIAALQAGMIGAWGEWHSSAYGVDDASDRGDVLRALLDAVPSTRSVQVRTPMFKDETLPGGPLSPQEAFSGSDRARVGHHNDCFLAGDSDRGTYDSPVSRWKDYVAVEGNFLPIGGETCAVNPPSTSCGDAMAELERQRWSYLNSGYHRGVLTGWRTEGCLAEIDRRLGYHLIARYATYTGQAARGGAVQGMIELYNDGFAGMYNPRPAYVVVSNNASRFVAEVPDTDVRKWRGGATTTVRFSIAIPNNAPEGRYRLSLWLPDPSADLTADPRYSVRLANEGMWDGATGENVLGEVNIGLDLDDMGELLAQVVCRTHPTRLWCAALGLRG